MGRNGMTTHLLKGCMAEALLKLMAQYPYPEITVMMIVEKAGVGRATWFRHFSSKEDALAYYLVQGWYRWAEEHHLADGHKYRLENVPDFFQFDYENRQTLICLHKAGLQAVVLDAFSQIMSPQMGADAQECYHARFYSFGLFGLLLEWLKRDFEETPEQMTKRFYQIIES